MKNERRGRRRRRGRKAKQVGPQNDSFLAPRTPSLATTDDIKKFAKDAADYDMGSYTHRSDEEHCRGCGIKRDCIVWGRKK